MGALKCLTVPQYLTNAATAVYTFPATVPSNRIARVTGIWVCNTDSNSHWFSLSAGIIGGQQQALFWKVPIDPYTTFIASDSGGGGFLIIDMSLFAITGLADVSNKVTISIYGEEII
jgi:hypothetical protein